MPRWRPRGCSKNELFAQDRYECQLRAVGRCLIPDGVASVVGENLPHALSLDHILEQAHFGSDHRPENLLTVHRYCNAARGPRPFVQFVGRKNAERLARLVPRVAPTILACLGG